MDANRTKRALDDLTEQLAAMEHERWSHWQRYVHSKCIPQGADGALLIPGDLVRRWEEQMAKPYGELSESEKESDREQVMRYLPLIMQALQVGAVPDL